MKEKIKSFQNNTIRLFKEYQWILVIALVILVIIGVLKIISSSFIWFILATIIFNIFYWYIIFSILSIPQIPVMGLILYAEKNIYKKWVRIYLFPITLVMGFIIGTFIPVSIFGGGLGLIALNFAENATYPLLYFIIAGFFAFTIAAPNGETTLLASFVSLFAFLMVIFKTGIELLIGEAFFWILEIFYLIIAILILILIGFQVIASSNFIVKRFILRNKVDNDDNSISQIDYFKGYCIFNIILMLAGLIFAILLGLFVVTQGRIAEISLIIFGLIAAFIYFILLYHLYEVSKFLRKEKLLSMNPVLILIITIILAYTFPLVSVIPFVIIWRRCNKYLKL